MFDNVPSYKKVAVNVDKMNVHPGASNARYNMEREGTANGVSRWDTERNEGDPGGERGKYKEDEVRYEKEAKPVPQLPEPENSTGGVHRKRGHICMYFQSSIVS